MGIRVNGKMYTNAQIARETANLSTDALIGRLVLCTEAGRRDPQALHVAEIIRTELRIRGVRVK